jgi:heat shock protein HslJ
MSKTVISVVTLLISSGMVIGQNPEEQKMDHTKWRLVELSQPPLKIPARTAFMLTFEGDFYSFSGCNLLSGKFRSEQQRIVSAAPVRSTRKACPDDIQAFDAAFSRLLAAGPKFQRTGKSLTLTDSNGAKWVFAEEPLLSKNAKTKFIYVAAFTKNCTGAVPMKCLQVRESKSQPWRLHYSGIRGFEHVPGIEYRLRIKEDRIDHPPADSSAISWYLDAVIEQSVVDRKAADEYCASKTQ